MGTLGALASAMLAANLGANDVVTAVAAAWGEVLGFYLPLFVREFMTQQQNGPLPQALWRTLRNLLLEFGVAECVDSGLMRPALMTAAMQLIPPLWLAILVSKVAADIFFYGLAIVGFELRQKLLGN